MKMSAQLTHTVENPCILNDIRWFLPKANSSVEIKQSTVHYLELLDEHPDTEKQCLKLLKI